MLGVIGTGVFTEVFRFIAIPPVVACFVYVLHLGVVLCLFLTLPYSKFAHIVYRTLAMVHQFMVQPEPAPAIAVASAGEVAAPAAVENETKDNTKEESS